MVNIHPDELFKKLYESASARKKRTLQLIHETCQIQSKSGIKDFSIGTMARLMKDKGGPSEQALRNNTPSASDYRTLISRWAEYSETTLKKPKKKTSSSTNDEILATMSNPSARKLVALMMGENSRLKEEISALKQQVTSIDMREPENNTLYADQSPVLSTSYVLTEMEVKALREAISDEFMAHRGWTVDEYGRVKEKGALVYKPGYVSAIKKVIKDD